MSVGFDPDGKPQNLLNSSAYSLLNFQNESKYKIGKMSTIKSLNSN